MTEEDERVCTACSNRIYYISYSITSCKSCRSSFLTFQECECGSYHYFHCRTCNNNMYKCSNCGIWKAHKNRFDQSTICCCDSCIHNSMVQELPGMEKAYPQYEFQINDLVLQFRYKCICNQHLSWMNWNKLNKLDEVKNHAIIQCERCAIKCCLV